MCLVFSRFTTISLPHKAIQNNILFMRHPLGQQWPRMNKGNPPSLSYLFPYLSYPLVSPFSYFPLLFPFTSSYFTSYSLYLFLYLYLWCPLCLTSYTLAHTPLFLHLSSYTFVPTPQFLCFNPSQCHLVLCLSSSLYVFPHPLRSQLLRTHTLFSLGPAALPQSLALIAKLYPSQLESSLKC